MRKWFILMALTISIVLLNPLNAQIKISEEESTESIEEYQPPNVPGWDCEAASLNKQKSFVCREIKKRTRIKDIYDELSKIPAQIVISGSAGDKDALIRLTKKAGMLGKESERLRKTLIKPPIVPGWKCIVFVFNKEHRRMRCEELVESVGEYKSLNVPGWNCFAAPLPDDERPICEEIKKRTRIKDILDEIGKLAIQIALSTFAEDPDESIRLGEEAVMLGKESKRLIKTFSKPPIVPGWKCEVFYVQGEHRRMHCDEL